MYSRCSSYQIHLFHRKIYNTKIPFDESEIRSSSIFILGLAFLFRRGRRRPVSESASLFQTFQNEFFVIQIIIINIISRASLFLT